MRICRRMWSSGADLGAAQHASGAGVPEARRGSAGTLWRAARLRARSTTGSSKRALPFDEASDDASAAVCVLGEKAKVSILGYGPRGRTSSSR